MSFYHCLNAYVGDLNTPKIYTESFYLPHLPKHTTFQVIYMSRISENPSTSHHLEGKSKSGSFYPPNEVWYTTFCIRYLPKYLVNEFVSVNYETLWNPTSQIRKFIDFTSLRYFYPKNDRVSMKNKVLKTEENNYFSLNSVNGGHSFLSKTNYDFF